MHPVKIVLIGLMLAACGASSANAQWSSTQPNRNIEITPFGGSRFGGVINTNSGGISPIDEFTIKSTWDYGAIADMDLLPDSLPGLQAEFMWSQEPTELGAHDAITGVTSSVGKLELNNYQWGIDYNLGRRSRLKPFIVAGMGFTHFSSGGDIAVREQTLIQSWRWREVLCRSACRSALRRALGAFSHYFPGRDVLRSHFRFLTSQRQ